MKELRPTGGIQGGAFAMPVVYDPWVLTVSEQAPWELHLASPGPWTLTAVEGGPWEIIAAVDYEVTRG